MYLRFSLSCLILFIYFSCTTSARAKNNGPRPAFPRRHHRRAAGLSEFLTPPPPPQHHNQPSYQNNPFRHGKILSSSPPTPTEAPGYFSRLMRWLSPFGRDLPPPAMPPVPQINHNNFQSEYLQPPPPPPPQNTYRPPLSISHVPQATQYHSPCISRPDQLLPQPPLPPNGQPYSPTINGKACNPCNTAPWIPIHVETGRNPNLEHPPEATGFHSGSYNLGNHEGIEIQRQNFYTSSPSQEVKPPDFGYGLPKNLDHQVLIPQQNLNFPQTQFDSPFTGPIPNPHIYPGAIPPLYKAADFRPEENEQQALNSEISSQLLQTPVQQENLFTSPPGDLYNQNLFPGSTPITSYSSEGYVDVLPPGAEIASESDQLTNTGEVHDNGGSSSDFHQVLYSTSEHEASAASLNPVVDTFSQNLQSFDIDNHNSQRDEISHLYGTKLPSDGQHIIHVEQSPVIDLSNSESNNKSSSNIAEPSVILQNADGTFGINASWPNKNSSHVVWPTEEDDALLVLATARPRQSQSGDIKFNDDDDNNNNNNNQAYENNSDPLLGQGTTSDSQNISSILIKVFQNSNNQTENSKDLDIKNSLIVGNATDKQFIDAIMKSYNNFEKKVIELKRPENWFDYTKDTNLGSEFGMSPRKENSELFEGNNRSSKSNIRQQGVKKNKQVQIIIPYTSQYTPEPFHPPQDQWNNNKSSKSQARKVLIKELYRDKNNHEQTISDKEHEELSYIIQALNNLPRGDIMKTKPSSSAMNTSIDVFRLQKNIDNWTIEEYSKGTTASMATPSASHPHLTQSKQIPEEYLTTTEPVATTIVHQKIKKNVENSLSTGFNLNDLDNEGSSSNQINVPHVQVSLSHGNSQISSELDSISSSDDMNDANSEDVSWEQLPVSISPLSNERVYVVTPQSALKPTGFNSNSTNERIKVENKSNNNNSTTQFESIERAYQVLPQAVNNLAVASTGPATVSLWGIMEHEEYASSFNSSTKKPETPILYSGHSKVAHTNQH